MKRNQISKLLLSGLLFAGLLTGCSGAAPDDLYALPKQSDSYYELQNAIDQVLPSGAEFSGPQAGSNRQCVQFVDLDGDADDEAVVFIKAVGELPMKAYIFDQSDDSYRNIAVIEGDGSSFDAVEYAQIDGKPGMEILLGRSLSDQILQSLAAYSYRDGQMAELMSCNYSEFSTVDLDGDDRKDVFVLRMDSDGRAGVAELYRWRDEHLAREQEAGMSIGAKQIKRIITGSLEGNVPAVFVASTYEEDTIITDIFALQGSLLQNIAISGDAGLSAQTVRSYNVYATDIDADGVIELPTPLALPSYVAGEQTQWIIDWYSMDINGRQKVKMSTYHNYSAGWFVTLPRNWHEQITVSAKTEPSGVPMHVFSKWLGYDREPEEIFTIYAFTGEDRMERATAEGRFLIAEKGEIAYAASMGDGDWAQSMTQEELSAMFQFIYVDWNTGET